MKQFDILFYKSPSVLGRLIRKISKSEKYSHTAFILDNYHCLELSWKDSCEIKHFRYKQDEYDIYELTVQLTDEEKVKLKNYITKYLNSGYDFKFLITRGLNLLFGTKIRSNKDKMTCDEIIYESLLSICICLFDGGYQVMTPELLSKSPLLRKIS